MRYEVTIKQFDDDEILDMTLRSHEELGDAIGYAVDAHWRIPSGSVEVLTRAICLIAEGFDCEKNEYDEIANRIISNAKKEIVAIDTLRG